MKTQVTSFGYDYDDPPEDADLVEDVRNSAYKPADWKARGAAIAKRAKGKTHVAIGDKHGHTRSVHIATHVAKQIKGTVSHRDKGKPRMSLLKGSSESVRTHNVHQMMQAGHSEGQAVTAAAKQQKASSGKKRAKKNHGKKPMPKAVPHAEE